MELDPTKFMEAMKKAEPFLDLLGVLSEILPPMKVVKDLKLTTTDDKQKKESKIYAFAILIDAKPPEQPKPEEPKPETGAK